MVRVVRCLLAGVLVATGACTSLPPPAPGSSEAECLNVYRQTDRVLTEADTLPAWLYPVPGFPYYRIDRFLAEFRHHELDPKAMAAWLERLSEADWAARRIALRNLSTTYRARLPQPVALLPQRLQHCARLLRAFDQTRPQRLAVLREQAAVPDSYITAARIIGLYPLVAIPVQFGIQRLREEFQQIFALPLDQLPLKGTLIRYGPDISLPPSTAAISRDALGIPVPDQAQWNRLFVQHAPIWEIDVAADYDRPGRPVWYAAGQPGVDPEVALTFHYPSYTWWRGQPVLQLNYLVWFDQRPLQNPFDILGGALDAVVWRVTLGPDGKLLLYDSIHACGCYHVFFPTPGLRLRAEALALPEPPLAPQTAPLPGPDQSIVIRLASGTHYIERIYADQANKPYQAYRSVDYTELYATPGRDSGQRSLFGADGLVSGSERAERLLLWPLGVAEPGAMRERGQHAVAFVGRRHFDDAHLLDNLFEPYRDE